MQDTLCVDWHSIAIDKWLSRFKRKLLLYVLEEPGVSNVSDYEGQERWSNASYFVQGLFVE